MPKKALQVFLVLCLIGFVMLIGAAGTNTFISMTSTTEFCISCHEMESTVYQETRKTVHYRSASGVRAGCADCHIPHDLSTTLWRKALAVKDIYHHLIGTIDTPEKFEARRLEMAKRVWASMEASDSRECRNCHLFEAMDLDKQRQRAVKQHQQAMDNGETCIDCHKGIAHKPVHETLETPGENEELLLEF